MQLSHEMMAYPFRPRSQLTASVLLILDIFSSRLIVEDILQTLTFLLSFTTRFV